ncbi:hypothetical protein Dimus_015628 [Dionaea muscipula]
MAARRSAMAEHYRANHGEPEIGRRWLSSRQWSRCRASWRRRATKQEVVTAEQEGGGARRARRSEEDDRAGAGGEETEQAVLEVTEQAVEEVYRAGTSGGSQVSLGMKTTEKVWA